VTIAMTRTIAAARQGSSMHLTATTLLRRTHMHIPQKPVDMNPTQYAYMISPAMSCCVHVYTTDDTMLGVYSKAAVACIRQNMYTADRNIPSSHLPSLPCVLVMLAACLNYLYMMRQRGWWTYCGVPGDRCPVLLPPACCAAPTCHRKV
jgi:hypothetical protein